MGTMDEKVAAVRAAAEAGQPDAARELGRLLCLLSDDAAEEATEFTGLAAWPAERWLRVALGARPDDLLTAVLLAGLLLVQIDHWQRCDNPEADESELESPCASTTPTVSAVAGAHGTSTGLADRPGNRCRPSRRHSPKYLGAVTADEADPARRALPTKFRTP